MKKAYILIIKKPQSQSTSFIFYAGIFQTIVTMWVYIYVCIYIYNTYIYIYIYILVYINIFDIFVDKGVGEGGRYLAFFN